LVVGNENEAHPFLCVVMCGDCSSAVTVARVRTRAAMRWTDSTRYDKDTLYNHIVLANGHANPEQTDILIYGSLEHKDIYVYIANEQMKTHIH
jgi:hypothetical protein